MKLNDIQTKVANDYEFWDKLVRVMEVINDQPISPQLRHLFVLGLSLNHETAIGHYDEPFIGRPFQVLVKEFGKTESQKGGTYAYPYHTASLYKKKLRALGWLKKDNKISDEWKRLQKAYHKEAELGIKSISFIYKICIC